MARLTNAQLIDKLIETEDQLHAAKLKISLNAGHIDHLNFLVKEYRGNENALKKIIELQEDRIKYLDPPEKTGISANNKLKAV